MTVVHANFASTSLSLEAQGKRRNHAYRESAHNWLHSQSTSVHHTVSCPDTDLPTNRKPLSEISNKAGQGIMQNMLNQ